jgi:ribonucleotide monophosphatase NagD (HAD superfamily)
MSKDELQRKELNNSIYCRLLLAGAPLIAIHCGRYYKRSDGLALGPGPFVRALEYASDCCSEVVGKPSPIFFQSALGDTDPVYAVMIGDVSLACCKYIL